MKKVLLLNQTFYPDNAATSQHLTDLALELIKRGYSVDVICDARSYENRSFKLPKYEVYKGIRINRINSTAFGKKTHFHRGLDYLSFNISFLFKMLTLPKYDIVIGLTTPPWISFFGVIFSLLKRAKFIHWAMDVNPDEAVKLGWVKQGSLFYKFLEWSTRFTYRKSEKIIALDDYMAQLIKSKGAVIDRIVVLPPWAHDDIEALEHDKNPFRNKHNLNGKFVIMYSGNFSICHPIDTLLETALRLRDCQDILFLFIGGGVRLREIVDFKEKYGLSNIIYLPYQKREDIKYSLSAADLHVVAMGEDYVGIVHPSKIYGILCTGRPFVLLGPYRSHVGDIIAENRIGYQVDHEDVEKMIKVINEVMTLKEQQKEKIKQISINLVKQKYSFSILVQKLVRNCFN
ncbi:MAG: glycosyltransferase family 4 protein [Nitrospirota bacterium]